MSHICPGVTVDGRPCQNRVADLGRACGRCKGIRVTLPAAAPNAAVEQAASSATSDPMSLPDTNRPDDWQADTERDFHLWSAQIRDTYGECCHGEYDPVSCPQCRRAYGPDETNKLIADARGRGGGSRGGRTPEEETRQDILDDLADIAGLPQQSPNSNSSVPAAFIRQAYSNVVGEPPPVNDKTGRPVPKDQVCRFAVELAGVAEWTDECDFSNKFEYASDTSHLLKNEGLRRYRDALAHLKVALAPTPA